MVPRLACRRCGGWWILVVQALLEIGVLIMGPGSSHCSWVPCGGSTSMMATERRMSAAQQAFLSWEAWPSTTELWTLAFRNFDARTATWPLAFFSLTTLGRLLLAHMGVTWVSTTALWIPACGFSSTGTEAICTRLCGSPGWVARPLTTASWTLALWSFNARIGTWLSAIVFLTSLVLLMSALLRGFPSWVARPDHWWNR
jgi:hypothetical protein